MDKTATLPLGIVLQRRPGVTRWVKWHWRAAAVLPGAGPAAWHLLRQDGDVTEYHACTLPLELHRTEVEAYRISLTMEPPSLFVILRDSGDADYPLKVHSVTASAYEAQDYMDSGEEQVEKVPMPDGLIAWIRDFSDAHARDEPFKKRKRDKKRIDLVEDGIGDVRIRQTADVYRAPSQTKPNGKA
ncbi:DUF3305 domain-containing protein [Actibacterium sp. 188UL27-1]|uniref:DUF3305 domain-containing protein n=1 Tax=Actibacterium sp. 188UL27-1 TaxID=2786961 RepID=UPI001EF418A8|nr:DUF3305 domain-containing protein [Actibacterium sp. 188UL27-1]